MLNMQTYSEAYSSDVRKQQKLHVEQGGCHKYHGDMRLQYVLVLWEISFLCGDNAVNVSQGVAFDRSFAAVAVVVAVVVVAVVAVVAAAVAAVVVSEMN
jgi:hypothetical protein